MTGILPLILSQEPVTRGLLARVKESRPNIAVVYSDAFGEIGYFGGRPLKWSELVASRYRTRYEVDLSDHRRTARLDSSPLPSRGDAYFFHSMVDVGFRVTDPAAVVKRNVTDGLTVVYNYLIDAFRPITRDYDIQEAAAAECAIHRCFQQPVTLDEGITIYRCSARLLPDEAAKDHLRSLTSAGRNLKVGAEEHKVAVAQAQQGQQLAELEQLGRLEAERRELGALREPVNLTGLIRTHLSKHPGDTDHVMALLAAFEQAQQERRGTDEQRWLDLVKYMMEKDVIQAVDVDVLRKQTLGKVEQIAGAAPAGLGGDGGWDRPLPVLSLVPQSSEPPGPSGGAADVQAGSIVPVYLAIDESVGDGGYFEALGNGLQALPLALSGQPGVLAAVRLGILGFAGSVTAYMPVNAINQDTVLPALTPRPGMGLASFFGYLHGQIPRDMDRLKARYPEVVRPTVYLLCASAAGNGPGWEEALGSVLDRARFRYAPNVIGCGAARDTARMLALIAGYPGCHAFAADPGLPLREAADRYCSFVSEHIAAWARARISGRNDLVTAPPDSFHIVDHEDLA